MSKSFAKKIVSITLAACMVFSGFSAVGASAASDFEAKLTHFGVATLGTVIKGLGTKAPLAQFFARPIQYHTIADGYPGTGRFGRQSHIYI